MLTADWLTWHVVDSALPTGAFAHSGGLESAWQHGEISTIDDLRTFVEGAILQTGYAVLPLLNASFRDPEALERLDQLADAFLTNAVANRASRVQGRALLGTASRIWPSEGLIEVKRRGDACCAHVAPMSGAVFRAIGLPLDTSQRVVLHNTARGVLAAAVRLGVAGSYDAHRLQHECAGTLERVAARGATLTVDDLAQTAPIADLFQSAHDRLYSRLFQS